MDATNSEKSLNWCQILIQKFISVFWILYNNRPKNPFLCTIYVHGEYFFFYFFIKFISNLIIFKKIYRLKTYRGCGLCTR